MAPAVLPIAESEPKVTAPTYVPVVAELLVSAPPLEIPVPFKVRALVAVMVVPLRSSAAPLVREMAPDPRAVAWPTFTVPAEMVVPPV